jgi:four helix bundle protein
VIEVISDRTSAIEHSSGVRDEGEFVSGSYRELKVWQGAIKLSVDIYKLTEEFPVAELYGLTSQLRRAAVSVASNIAEGYGRASRGEFRRFVAIARGSAMEIQTQLVIANELGFGDALRRRSVEVQAEETGKRLWGLMQTLHAPAITKA